MGSRVQRPEIEIIPLSQGDAITVKKYLTAGEFRAIVKASTKPVRMTPGESGAVEMEIDPTESGLALVLAYLLDWTFTDADGRPIVIRDQPGAVVRSALDLIDRDSYLEVQTAVQTHEAAMRAAIAEEKKLQNSAIDCAPSLPSVG